MSQAVDQNGSGATVDRSPAALRRVLVADTIVVAGLTTPERSYALAMAVLAVLGLVGLAATVVLPRNARRGR